MVAASWSLNYGLVRLVHILLAGVSSGFIQKYNKLKPYNTLVVTDTTTNPPLTSLTLGERT